MPTTPVKVFIVSDMELIKNALKTLFENVHEGALEIIGVACSGEELLLEINTLQADVLLLDNQLPDMNGVNLIEKIQQENPLLKIVLMTLYKGLSFAMDAIRQGAKGVLTKRAEPKTIARIIIAIHNKGIVIYLKDDRPSICEKIRDLMDQRDLKIVCLMAKGLTSKEICKQLNLGESNLELIKRRLYDKAQKLEEFKEINRQGIGNKLVFFVGTCNFL